VAAFKKINPIDIINEATGSGINKLKYFLRGMHLLTEIKHSPEGKVIYRLIVHA